MQLLGLHQKLFLSLLQVHDQSVAFLIWTCNVLAQCRLRTDSRQPKNRHKLIQTLIVICQDFQKFLQCWKDGKNPSTNLTELLLTYCKKEKDGMENVENCWTLFNLLLSIQSARSCDRGLIQLGLTDIISCDFKLYLHPNLFKSYLSTTLLA